MAHHGYPCLAVVNTPIADRTLRRTHPTARCCCARLATSRSRPSTRRRRRRARRRRGGRRPSPKATGLLCGRAFRPSLSERGYSAPRSSFRHQVTIVHVCGVASYVLVCSRLPRPSPSGRCCPPENRSGWAICGYRVAHRSRAARRVVAGARQPAYM